MNNKDFFNVSGDLENVRDVYLQMVGHKLFELHKDEDEIKKKLEQLGQLSYEDLKNRIIENFYKIESGEADEKELENLELEISLLFCVIPLDAKNVNEAKRASEYWRQKQQNIEKKEPINDEEKVVIEIAACHPLQKNNQPNAEFQSRLDRAIEIYNLEKQNGNKVILYIPGSVHSIQINDEMITDGVSLSEAGKQYLLSKGIPEEDIRGPETNDKYKENGVYNSGDESFVTTKIAEDEGCERIIAVISPVQIYRKALFFTEFGYNAEIHTVPLENEAHNYIGETFFSLYVTYFKDHDWQNGFLAAKTRHERDVTFRITEDIKAVLEKGEYIPEYIKHLRAVEMEKYGRASQKMKAASNNSALLIDYVHNTGITDKQERKRVASEEIRKIVEICKKHKESEITICTNLDATKSDIIRRILELYSINDIDVIHQGSIAEIGKEFDKRNGGRLFGVYPADESMARAIKYIQQGYIPLVETVPSKSDDYVSKIDRMYESIILDRDKEEER